jgi:hypothetical protein
VEKVQDQLSAGQQPRLYEDEDHPSQVVVTAFLSFSVSRSWLRQFWQKGHSDRKRERERFFPDTESREQRNHPFKVEIILASPPDILVR